MAFRQQSKNNYWYLVSVFILFTMTIVMLGYFFYEHQKKIIKQEKKDQLDAIADLKTQQVINWRQALVGDAMVILENQFLLSNIHQWLENPSDSIRKGKILTWMTSLQKHFGYKDIDLLDTKGTLRLSIPEGNRRTCSYTQAMTGEAIRTKKIVFMDLHRSDNNDEIHLGIAIPLLVPKGDDIIPIGVLHLLIDPYQFLYPLIQSWPTPSSTGESLLVRREGEEALFLNELRHGKNTALTLRVPISKQRMPAAIAALGGEGIVEGIDYRGIFVLAAIRRIPESPWSLIAKVDQEEIYAPIRQQVWFTGIVVGLLIAGSGLGLGLLWRHQRVEFYKSQYKAELERQALTQHFDYLTKYANDIILLENQDLKIIEANERALASYGYTRDELLQLNAWDLRSPETKPLFDSTLKQVEEQDGLVFETMHQRKDGTTFPVEISIRIIEVEGKKFYQAIIRDITERKQAEEVLRQSEERFRELFDNAPVGYHEYDIEGRITNVNRTELDMLCYTLEERVGQFIWSSNTEEEKSRQTILGKLAGVIPPDRSLELTYRRKDGTTIPVLIQDQLLKDKNGRITGIRATIQDITERKQVEEEYRTITRTAMDGFWIVDIQGRFLDVNDAYCRLIGYSRDELLTMRISDIEAVERPEETARRIQKTMEVGGDRFETRHKCKDGRIIDIEVSANYMKVGGGRMFVFIRDITERKRAEESIKRLSHQNELILNCIEEGIFGLDLQGNHTFINPSAARMLGYEVEELIGQHSHTMWHHTKADGNPYTHEECPIYATFQSETLHHVTDEVFWRKDGTSFPAEYTSIPIFDEGKCIGAVVTFKDITERIQAGEALRKAEERYRNIFENAVEGIYQSTPDGRFIDVNPSLAFIHGYDSSEEIINTVSDISRQLYVNPYQRSELKRLLEEQEAIHNFEIQVYRKDKSTIWVSLNARAIHDSRGNVSYYEGIVQDISERKRAEEEREKLIQELQKALTEVKTLSGLIPICASCKKIRDDKGYWNQIETYIRDHSDADFSHGICPACARKLYPELYKEDIKNRKGNAG